MGQEMNLINYARTAPHHSTTRASVITVRFRHLYHDPMFHHLNFRSGIHRFQHRLDRILQNHKSAGNLRNLQTMCRCTVAQILLENEDRAAGHPERGLHLPHVDLKPVQRLSYSRDAAIIHVIFEALDLVADVL